MSEWIDVHDQLPKNGVVVDTKIDDPNGLRNEQQLLRENRLWFFPDRSMYVYFWPTHWRLPTGDT